MKKFFPFGFLLLIVACQRATPTPTAESTPMPTLRSTPIPVTVTTEPTLPPTFSPTPLPQYFSNEFDTTPVGWSILQSSGEGSPQVTTKDGMLLIQLNTPFTWIYSIYGAYEYTGVHIEARFQNLGGSPASMGVICDYSESNGWYEYNILTDGTYNVLYGKWLANGIAQYTPMLNAKSEYLKPGGAANEIGMDCAKDTLLLYANGKLFRKVNTALYRLHLESGKVGLAISSFENAAVNVAVERVKVSEP